MRQLASTDPAGARSLLLEPSVLQAWTQANPALAPLFESAESFDGQAEVIIADPGQPDTPSVWIYRYYADLKPVEAYLSGAEAVPATCDSILHIEGLRLGDRVIVTQLSETGRAQEIPRCTPLGRQRVAVLMVNFPGVAQPPITRQQVAGLFFAESGRTVHSFYHEGSFGQVTIEGEVFGWYELDRAYTCDESTQLRAAAIRAADIDVDFREYDRIYILFTRPADGCPWTGLGTIGCANSSSPGDGAIRVSTAWQPVANNANGVVTIATHELGHNFGLAHARTLRFPGVTAGPDRTQAISSEYGDRFSTMGNLAVSHHTMAHKIRMGWHDATTAVTEVNSDGEFEIMPMQAEGGKPRALRIRRNIGAGQWLWVEYRQPIGIFDSAWPTNVRAAYNGALIRLEDALTGNASDLLHFSPPPIANFAGSSGNFIDPTLKPGRIWQDPYSDLSLQVLAATPDALRVAVRYEPHCVKLAEAAPALLRGVLTIPGDLDRVLLKAEAPSDCAYSVRGNNYWIQPDSAGMQGSASIEIPLAPNLETAPRAGSLSLGRNTILARQDGRPEPPSITFVAPAQGEISRSTPTAWQIGYRDPNGAADIRQVHLLVHTGLELTRACYLRVDFGNNRFGLAGDSGGFTEQAIAANRMVRNSHCEVTYTSRVLVNPLEGRLQVGVRFLSPASGPYRVFAQAVDSSGRSSDWQEYGTVTFSDACVILPTPGRIVSNAGGGTLNLVIQTSAGCPWNVSSTQGWITTAETAGMGQRMIAVTVLPNPDSDDRRGVLRIGGAEVQVEQFGTQNTDVASISLTPRETTTGAAGGEVRVTVSASPSSFRWTPEPNADWIAVSSIRNGVVSAHVAPNETGAPRQGWLLIGGRIFGITQLAN